MSRAKGQLTQQQIDANRGLRDSIAISSLTKDELKLILFFLYQWETATGYDNHCHLVPNPNVTTAPPNQYNTANFARLRYKIEHGVYPKQIS